MSRRVLALYREFYKQTANCLQQNLKLYIRRRAAEQFRQGRNCQAASVNSLVQQAEQELNVIKRTMQVYSTYDPTAPHN